MKYLPIILILCLAAVLRLTAISQFPVGFNADEAALGYNAYSLLETGRDEHGHPWPINLESFGDFKPALYAYILIPFIKVLGLTELAVRLPSALFGIAAVFGIYLLCKELFKKDSIAVLSALFLAISPWHLHFTRGAWEVNIATTFILFGVYFFIKWLSSKSVWFLGFSILGFVLSMYSYQSARILAPLLGLGLIVLNYKSTFKNRRHLLIGSITLSFLLLPLVISIITSDASSRFSGVGFTSDVGPLNRVNELRGQYPSPNLIGKLLHNRPIIYTLQFVSNYLSHFDGDFLFVNGDLIERNKIPETGLLYMVDAVFILFGLIFIIRKSNLIKHKSVIFLWLLIAPLPAALTFQVPHALRAQNLVIPLTIIIACGAYQFLMYIGSFKYWKFIAYCLLPITYLWSASRYLHQYYVHYPYVYPSAWQFGFKELVTTVSSETQPVLITNKYDQPYILFLFYSQFPPRLFQGNHTLTVRDKFNFSTVNNFANFTFIDTSWDKVRNIHPALIVAAPDDIPTSGVNIIKTINYPNGQPVFKIISN